MKIKSFFILLVAFFCSVSVFAQYSFDKAKFSETLSNENSKCYAIKQDTLVVKQINNNELEINGHKYSATEQDIVISTCVFYNAKLKTYILLVDKTVDYSIGCDIILIKDNNIKVLGEISVAAYTKDRNGRMNYNSILPFISIVKISDRIIFSFETPLVVVHPGLSEETTMNGRDIYYTYSKSKLQMFK
jgi:hypothetical protein